MIQQEGIIGKRVKKNPNHYHCRHSFRAQSKDIVDKICRLDQDTDSFQMVVPLKDRCGVRNPIAINKNEKCTCKEMNDEGVGKSTFFFYKENVNEMLAG